MVSNKTYNANAATVVKGWWVIDAEGQTLGRLASKIAKVVMGKHKPTFTPNVDCGDFVIVTNAKKVAVTGNRLTEKKYYQHSMYAGAGIKEENLRDMLQRNPDKAIRLAVWGMIPKGRLGRRMITKLKVYGDSEHPHKSQMPKELK
jgi:large subunit ribosomal protein L13